MTLARRPRLPKRQFQHITRRRPGARCFTEIQVPPDRALLDNPPCENKDRTGRLVILRTVAAQWAKPNGIFAWDHVDMDALRALLQACPGGVAAILRLMGEDYQAMRDGFPDLMTEKDDAVSFIEVKAEGDVIRRNQLTRLRQLGNAGIKAEIARVDFRFDPEQDYVVVDIETTGGWSNRDRITEIGAVKLRDHEVVAEWHSLINPQRSIPANITRLTGITNDMVRGGACICRGCGQLHAVHGGRDFRSA
jgi:hypothetical protein